MNKKGELHNKAEPLKQEINSEQFPSQQFLLFYTTFDFTLNVVSGTTWLDRNKTTCYLLHNWVQITCFIICNGKSGNLLWSCFMRLNCWNLELLPSDAGHRVAPVIFPSDKYGAPDTSYCSHL